MNIWKLKIKKNIPFIMAPKTHKTNYVKHIYADNYNTMIDKIKEDLNK